MKAKHCLITGSSGGGKSTKAKEMHATANGCSVYLTTKSRESSISGKRVSGKKGLTTAVTRASRASDVRLKVMSAQYPRDTKLVREWAHAVREQKGWSVQIVVDECQNTPLSDGEGALKAGLHEDRDMGIKWVPVTQAPQDLKEARGYPGINQCRYIVWCGPAKTFHSGFIRYYGLDGLLPEEDYTFHVIEPSRPPRVVYRGETNPTYG